MAYPNLSNLCIFEGRITNNIKFSNFQANGQQVEKVDFSISVPNNLTSAQKQKMQSGDQSIKATSFVQCQLTGAKVNTIRNNFPAGTPIKVLAVYVPFEYTNSQTGQKSYGHRFDVVDIGFVSTPAQNNGNNNGGGNYQQPMQNNNGYAQQPQNQMQQPMNNQAPQGNFEMFPENNYPF